MMKVTFYNDATHFCRGAAQVSLQKIINHVPRISYLV